MKIPLIRLINFFKHISYRGIDPFTTLYMYNYTYIFRYISDQDYMLRAPCPPSCTLHLLSIILREGVMWESSMEPPTGYPFAENDVQEVIWEPSMGTSHRLPKPVSRKQLINRVTNNRNRTGNVTSRFYIGFA
jgi:hypothetical protein